MLFPAVISDPVSANTTLAPSRAGLTVWRALRTPQRRGPTEKLDVEETEIGMGGVSPSPANYGSAERCISYSTHSSAEPQQKKDLVKLELENASDHVRNFYKRPSYSKWRVNNRLMTIFFNIVIR